LGSIVFDLNAYPDMSLEQIRQSSFNYRDKDPSTVPAGVLCAGWHCSSCLPAESFKEKLRRYAHVINEPDAKEIEYLFHKCPVINSKCYRTRSWKNLPPVVVNQWEKYSSLLPK
jgi:hypothetical protein